jgi:glycosyltransferase involved in cell wall biosynthesis
MFDSHREGSEFAWAYNIAHRLGSMCPGSVVVTGRNDVTDSRTYPICELTPNERRTNMGNLHALRFNLLYTATSLRALRARQFDIVHHVLPFAIGRTFNLTAMLPRRRTPFVIGPVQAPLAVPDVDIDQHDIRAATRQAGRRRRLSDGATASVVPLLERLSSETLRKSDRVVAVDQSARQLLLRRGVLDEQIAVIPAGIDCDRFAAHDATDEPARALRLLVVCHLVRRKNVAVVLRAFAQARHEGADARLTVVGDGPQLPSLRDAARSFGIEREVDFVGHVPHAQIHEHYSAADVFLNASMAESFSSTCLEAMASGVPPVSTDVGVFGDAIREGNNGYLIAQDDHRTMAARIVELNNDRQLLRTLSQRARTTVVQRFDWKRVVIPRYLELYGDVVASAR